MSNLPAQGYTSNAARTNAEIKVVVEDLRDFMAELPGGNARTELTIASGAVVPPDGAGGGHHTIDTEGNAASDDLTSITTTNTPEGRIVVLWSENIARVVTVKNAAGGAGQVTMADNADFVFASLQAWLMIQRRGADWVEIARYVPTEDLTELTSTAAGDFVEIWDDSAGTKKKIAPTVLSSPGAFRNRVINGDVRVDQRRAGTAATVNSTSTVYGPDMWRGEGESADGVFTLTRSTTTPPNGYSHFLRATVTTADASIGATQSYTVCTVFEGANMVDLAYGTSSASVTAISFMVRSSLTGTFSGALSNAAANRTYPFSFAINSANTWESKSVVLNGDQSGTWPNDATMWGSLIFDLGAGASVRATASAWTATANVVGATSAASLIATNGATFDVTAVQLEQTAATSFERIDFMSQIELCERYHQKSFSIETAEAQNAGLVGAFYAIQVGGASSSQGIGHIRLSPQMRATPTVTFYNPSAASAEARNTSISANWSSTSVTNAAPSGFGIFGTSPAASALGNNTSLHWSADAEL